MSMNKSDNTILFNNDFNINNLSFTDVKEAKNPKGSKEAYLIYNNLDKVFFQLTWFNLNCYGIPQLGVYFTENKQRLFIKVPLDLTIPSVKEVYDKFITIDSYLSSETFKSKILESSKINKYVYQPIVRFPEEESKNKLPYIKINFDVDYTDSSIKTILFKSVLDGDKRVRTKMDNIVTIDDVTQHITYQSNIRPIIRPVRLWIQPSNTKDPNYGLKFSMVKVEFEPSQNTKNNINYKIDNFIDNDKDTDEIMLCKNFNIDYLSFSDIKDAKLPKGSKEAYPFYKNNLNKNIDLIQLPWFHLISYGIPQLGDFVTENKQRLFIKIPLDLSIPTIKEAYDKLLMIDSHLGSDIFKNKVLEPSKINKYVYQSIIRIPENDDDSKIRYPYIKIHFDTNYDDNTIKTSLFNTTIDKNEINRTFIENIKEIDDVTKYITYLSKIRPIIKPVRLWIQPSNTKDPKYGLKLKIIKVEIQPTNKHNYNYQDDTFIDNNNLNNENLSEKNTINKNSDNKNSESESESESKKKTNVKLKPQILNSESSDSEIEIKTKLVNKSSSSSSTPAPKSKQPVKVLDSESESESDSNKEIKPVKKAVSKSLPKKK